MKIEDSAVLEEAAENASNANGFAYAWDSRAQRTYSADNQIDLHTGMRRLIEETNHAGIFERVHLEDEMAIAMFAMPLDLHADQALQAGAQALRSNQQLAIGLLG